MADTFFVDCSNHDWSRGPMDLAAMKRDGIAGGWHKLSDGLNYYVDPYFSTFASRARAANWDVIGAYHVLWGNEDIRGQALWFLSLLDAKAPWWRDMGDKFVIMSDDEPFGYNVKPSIDQVNTFGDVIRGQCGRSSIAYVPTWVYGSSVGQARYPVVGSNYGSDPRSGYVAAYPGDGSSRWGAHDALLQYGSLLTVGSQPECDVNAFRGTLDDFVRLLGGSDMSISDIVPNTGGRNVGTVLSDVWHGMMDGKSGYNPAIAIPLASTAQQAATSAAAAAAKLDALTSLLQGTHDLIANAGGNIDTAAIITHLDQLATEAAQREADLVQKLQAENVTLRQALGAAAQKEADVFNQAS